MATDDDKKIFTYIKDNFCKNGNVSLTLDELDSIQEKFQTEDLHFYKNIFDEVPCTISVVNRDLEYIKVNQTLANLCHLETTDFIGKEVGFFTNNKYFYNFVHKLFKSDAGKLSQEISTTFNDEKKVFWVSGNIINGHKEALLIGVDITGIKQLEDQAEFNEKLTALGEMVAGIIHDIKNPLTVIMASSKSLKRSDNQSVEKILKFSERITNTSNRILKIVNSVKVFVRNAEDDPFVKSDLKDLIEEASDVCNSKIHKNNIEVIIMNPEKSFSTSMNTTKIFQVFVNLFSNSCDAISDFSNSDKRAWISLEFDQENLIVKFRDCGKGIPESVQESIFKAFFTTKSVGVGSGLGLSNCRRIMKEHGGDIVIDNDDENTCFVIQFSKNE
ncbi:hypothetical protein A9Q84_06100 [Halobacteriovorax marinus]|uniref:histidine kinase n=1 Tax=Halobacteriovorax marinus TaxID=97084 RepID=A0A1Y5F998_9BACT|nr:hypothetical protein A9Q84_06100 [Halobacteriovorax marinus]